MNLSRNYENNEAIHLSKPWYLTGNNIFDDFQLTGMLKK